MKLIDEDYREELLNSLTHGLGVVLCVVAIPVLMTCVASKGGTANILSVAIYAFSLLMVYTSSTVYHIVTHKPTKKWLQLIDHICIYFLIAGSYTPFLVIFLYNSWVLLAVLWTLAAIGTIIKCITGCNRYTTLSVIFYVIMGWAGLIKIPEIYQSLPGSATTLLLLGGISYSIGVIFFMWEKLKYHHAIWHIFVLGGSAAHYAALMFALNTPTT